MFPSRTTTTKVGIHRRQSSVLTKLKSHTGGKPGVWGPQWGPGAGPQHCYQSTAWMVDHSGHRRSACWRGWGRYTGTTYLTWFHTAAARVRSVTKPNLEHYWIENNGSRKYPNNTDTVNKVCGQTQCAAVSPTVRVHGIVEKWVGNPALLVLPILSTFTFVFRDLPNLVSS